MTSPAQTIVTTLANQLITDAAGDGTSLLETFFTNINTNPTQANVVAQSLLLAVQAPLTLPNLETAAIQQVSLAGLALIKLLKIPTIS